MEKITTPNAPIPVGHYSQAVVHNGLVFVSGQLPLHPDRRTFEVYSIEEQTRQALTNLKEILTAAGSDLSKVLKVTVYIADISLWGRVNEVYAAFFGDHKPARAVVPTKNLHYGFMIEIDAIAFT
jgi:2-iminobutanoate/2-iminopropanoate deaminase